MIKCSKCQREKDNEEFSFRNKEKGKRNTKCKLCSKKYLKIHYKKNKPIYIKRALEFNKVARQRNLEYLKEYKQTHPCIDCGNSNWIVLEFDHRENKVDNVANMAMAPSSLKILQLEIAKCDIRCANCHRVRTYEERSKTSQLSDTGVTRGS